MQALLIGIIRTDDMHVVAGQGTVDRTCGVQWQVCTIHGRLLPDTMAEADAVALAAELVVVRLKLTFG